MTDPPRQSASPNVGSTGKVWLVVLSAILLVAAIWLVNLGSNRATVDSGGGVATTSTTASPTTPFTTAATDVPLGEADGPPRFSELDPILVTELPLEAIDTLDSIANGGPFDFDRDGLVFQNREGLLPDREEGHYREYTVITPGERTRGARRIVAGADGELYYTGDHYASFSEIVDED